MDHLCIRHYKPSDETAAVDIFNRAGGESGGKRVTAAGLRGDLSACRAGRDALLALWGGAPVGFAWMRRTEGHEEEIFLTWGAVLPEYQRRGVGTALMKRFIALATARRNASGAPSRVGMLTSSRRPGAHELAASLGFQRLTGALWMERSTRDLSPVPVPEGLRFRRFEAGRDEGLYAELFNRAFADHFPRNHLTAEQVGGMVAAGLLEAEGTTIAEVRGGGELRPGAAGLCGSALWLGGGVDGRSGGTVLALGVLPEFRSRGLGRALLVHTLARLAARGAERAGLRVIEDNHVARALYDSLGFAEVEAEIIWRLELA